MNFGRPKRRFHGSLLSGFLLHNGFFWASLCSAILFSGCSQQQRPDYTRLGLAEVTGTIRLDEKPLANAHVIFEAPDQSHSFGKTNNEGKYTLMFNSEQSGVLPGQKIVRIQLKSFSEEDADQPSGDEAADDQAPVLELATDSSELPSTYNRNSQLTAEVASGFQTINFDLKSDGSTRSRAQ